MRALPARRWTAAKWRIVTFAHVAATREQARKDVEFGLKDFARYFTDVATFPIIPPDIDDPSSI